MVRQTWKQHQAREQRATVARLLLAALTLATIIAVQFR